MSQVSATTTEPTAPVLTESAFDGSLTVIERNGTTHVLHPYPTVEGVNKMTWVAETGERIEAKLAELQGTDVLDLTDEVIDQIGHLQRQSARLSEELMRALVPDYPQGLFGRLHVGVAMAMQAHAMQVAMKADVVDVDERALEAVTLPADAQEPQKPQKPTAQRAGKARRSRATAEA